jgi:hypothetical protein
MSRAHFQHSAVSDSQAAEFSDAGSRISGSTKWSVLGANNDAVLGKRDLRKIRFKLSENPTLRALQITSDLPVIREELEAGTADRFR